MVPRPRPQAATKWVMSFICNESHLLIAAKNVLEGRPHSRTHTKQVSTDEDIPFFNPLGWRLPAAIARSSPG
jgi:hypothetical protein